MGKGMWLRQWVFFCMQCIACVAPTLAAEVAVVNAPPVELRIANRSIFLFTATLLGETPAARARRAEVAISEVLDSGGTAEVRMDPIQDSYLILLGDRRAFIVAPKDLAPVGGSVRDAAEAAMGRLRLVVEEAHQARSLRFLLVATGLSVLATLLYVLLLRLLAWLHARALTWMPKRVIKHSHALRLGNTQVLDSMNLYSLVRRLLSLLRWVLLALLTYEWLTYVLQRFPYTRPWGESLNQHLIELVELVLGAVVGAVPGLSVALLIFFLARGAQVFVRRLLERLSRPEHIAWLNAETLKPTIRLTTLAIWLFALAMAYPYLPGSDTDAFKGLSVLVGLMISLGATSVVGQAAAGLILTYTRTLRPGEFVRVGEHEGTVTEVGAFTTRIRTGVGEVLTLPNSMITGAVTRNYSRLVDGPGYVLDTVVTIGYDTPWRQVEAMLLEAARRTPGVLNEPPPRVLQTALSDYYPEYRLVAQAIPEDGAPRPALLSLLHAHIQDVFNEYGVQIMSPNYVADPKDAKLVAPEQWFAAPAQAPEPPRKE